MILVPQIFGESCAVVVECIVFCLQRVDLLHEIPFDAIQLVDLRLKSKVRFVAAQFHSRTRCPVLQTIFGQFQLLTLVRVTLLKQGDLLEALLSLFA